MAGLSRVNRGRDRGRRQVSISGWTIGAAVVWAAVSPPHIAAQEQSAKPGSPEIDQFAVADSIRAEFDRPPAEPAADWVDVAEFPLKVIGFPLDLLFVKLPGWVVSQVMTERAPSGIVRAFRSMENWGFRPVVRTSIGPRSSLALEGQLFRFEPWYAH